jgi:two-component system chemotaxis response regulator CheY
MVSVLIVDDDDSIRLLCQKILALKGFEVVATASNGDEAIKYFKSFSKKPDVILMDYRMPVKNGLDATKEILQIDNTTKIIFTSADISVKNSVFDIGAAAFVLKPFKIDSLIENINNVLS